MGELCATPLSGQGKSSQVKSGRWLSSAVCFRYLDNVVCWRCASGCTGAAWQGMAIGRDGQQLFESSARGADAAMDHGRQTPVHMRDRQVSA